ncbi:ATP-binding protein [Desulfovibrio sp. JC022]|uniref:ATP-binding protein n=1 Tax=Desulfovibrio sp. JC022 TaxID=2593642 RepID=UPI0013D5456F|nr:ATP-binding protein [Desulfovibrio sp. JC022]NDV22506.1 ATP-binding protein [Desulfovibrio sp. JC022]
MDPIFNPFVPGAGTTPAKLAGRDDLLDKTRITLARVKAGRNAKSFIIVGLRGVGKTVLLNQIYEKAEERGYLGTQIEAHEDKSLPALLIPKIRQLLIRLDRGVKTSSLAKRGLGVLAAFTNAIKITYGDVEIGLSIDPELGSADSGDLEVDLADLFEAVGRAAQERETALLLSIDELQYIKEAEMSALIMAMHRVAQRGLPLILIGGGLPQLVGQAGRSKSYAERLFDYPEIGALNNKDAALAIREPIKEEGADITKKALEDIYSLTKGYPYFLQTWGHYAWNEAEGESITADDVRNATPKVIKNLDESFFRVRFDRLTPTEKQYLFAMASLGPGPHRSGDIARVLKKGVQNVAPFRSALIKKGMIYSPAHGDNAFTVPMFDQYLNRISQEQ